MTARFFLLGDVMVDVTAIVGQPLNYASDTPAKVTIQPGGAAANTACWLAHDGEDATLIGAIGDDPFGDIVTQNLAAFNVSSALATIDGSTTGACIVIVDQRGERTMLPDPGANAGLAVEDLPTSSFRAGDHLHLSGYTLLNAATRAVGMSALHQAREAGMTTSLDPASAAPLAHDPAVFDAALLIIDLLIANEAEASVLTGIIDPGLALASLSGRVPTVVVKRGHLGSIAQRARVQHEADAVTVSVVDTTGAGDAFAAGFLPPWILGRDLAECLGQASISAARAVARVGAGPGFASPGE
ncbi:MAG: sugar kinase [Actinobacteria bacterium]|nr:sugar kinase [Actinomycetota bacterium]